MSKINDLIEKMCPSGVRYINLGELVSISTGKLNANAMVEDGEYAFFTCDATPFKINKYAFDGEAILISGNGSQVGHLNYYVGKFNAYQRTYVLMDFNNIIMARYLYHYLDAYLKKHIDENSKKGSIPYITLPMLQKFKVAVPPIDVQKEIILIFNKFIELRENLEMELEARKKQHEFWSEKIFESYMNKNIKHITDIALVKARVGWQRLTTAEYLNTGDYYLITGTDFKSDGRIDFSSCVCVTKERYEMDENIQVHMNDILITKDGTLGKVAFLDNEPTKQTTLNSGVFRIKIIDDGVMPRYIYHYFNSKIFKDFVESVKTGSTIPHLTQEKLVKLNIPIPSIDEQKRIISILDKFDLLTRSTTIGIPAEIELRKQQYEYYKNKLLSFEELSISE